MIDMRTGSVQDLIDAGIMFCGTPDQVYEQIVDFFEHCGGMGNLLMMGHAGPMSHADTVENLTLFAKEVIRGSRSTSSRSAQPLPRHSPTSRISTRSLKYLRAKGLMRK